MEKPFRTLRGYLSGSERDEQNYFRYSATLRIFGEIPDIGEISSRLGLSPTYSHRKGERRSGKSAPSRHDMWSYTVPVEASQPLHEHIDRLWIELRPHKRYLLVIKKTLSVDVFLGYRTNCHTARIEVPSASLEMFTELEIPFGLSIIVT